MTPVVLVHGGGFAASCWDLLRPVMKSPVMAVDLPGRGSQPAPLDEVTFASCAEAVERQVDAAGFDRFVLVGHSLAGCSMPAMTGRFGSRISHLVFLACTVPEDGTACFDTLDQAIQERADDHEQSGPPSTLDRESVRSMFGNDLSDEQIDWCMAHLVPEAPGLITERVDLSPFRQAIPRTWIRTLHDAIVTPAKQDRFAANVGDCPVVDIDAAHMSMVGRPEETAEIIDGIAAAGAP